jgi:hypothetical protein
MIWIAIQGAQVTAGVGFALPGDPWLFLPHAVGKWFSSLRDILADSECRLATANAYTVCLLMDDALAGWSTDSDIQAINGNAKASHEVTQCGMVGSPNAVWSDPPTLAFNSLPSLHGYRSS